MNARKHPPGLDVRIEEPVGRMGAVGTRERSIDELVDGVGVTEKTGLGPQSLELLRYRLVAPRGPLPLELLERRQFDLERNTILVQLVDLLEEDIMRSPGTPEEGRQSFVTTHEQVHPGEPGLDVLTGKKGHDRRRVLLTNAGRELLEDHALMAQGCEREDPSVRLVGPGQLTRTLIQGNPNQARDILSCDKQDLRRSGSVFTNG